MIPVDGGAHLDDRERLPDRTGRPREDVRKGDVRDRQEGHIAVYVPVGEISVQDGILIVVAVLVLRYVDGLAPVDHAKGLVRELERSVSGRPGVEISRESAAWKSGRGRGRGRGEEKPGRPRAAPREPARSPGAASGGDLT